MAYVDVAKVIEFNKPSLCFDTCAVLDLMRSPTREDVRPHDRRAALELLNSVESAKAATLLMAEQVKLEFDEHVDKVEKETDDDLKKFRKNIWRIDEVTKAYGISGLIELNHLENHAAHARKIVDRWIGQSQLIKPGDIYQKVVNRVLNARAPASKGKDSMKDCYIIETYIEFVAKLRNENYNAPVVFVTTNKKDYCEVSSSYLRTELAEQFDDLQIKFALNLDAAKHLLGF
jgi:hypothetical protein